MRLENQTALITGSSGGIGEEFARQLALRGANLILVARRADKLDQLRTELLERSPALKIDVVTADLSIPGSAADLAVKVEALGRRVDILVNNAGVGLHGDFVSQDRAANAAQIQLNCVTLVELTALYPACHDAGWPRHGHQCRLDRGIPADPGMAVYGATKAFVLSFTEAIWQETKSTAVRVFALCRARLRLSSSLEPARSS